MSGQHVPMLMATEPPRREVVGTKYLRVVPTPPSSQTLNMPGPSLINVLVAPSNDFWMANVTEGFLTSTVPVPFRTSPPVHDFETAASSNTTRPPSISFKFDCLKSNDPFSQRISASLREIIGLKPT